MTAKMKTAKDPRHLKRIHLMQQLFSWDFNPKLNSFSSISQIIKHLKKIDQKIALAAPQRPIKQLNKIDLAILRLGVFELIMDKKAPPKVVVDEAVELGKHFGSDASGSFINGVLGTLIEKEKVKT